MDENSISRKGRPYSPTLINWKVDKVVRVKKPMPKAFSFDFLTRWSTQCGFSSLKQIASEWPKEQSSSLATAGQLIQQAAMDWPFSAIAWLPLASLPRLSALGGSSTTSVIATSSPVGLTAVTGASFNATTGGSSTAFYWLGEVRCQFGRHRENGLMGYLCQLDWLVSLDRQIPGPNSPLDRTMP